MIGHDFHIYNFRTRRKVWVMDNLFTYFPRVMQYANLHGYVYHGPSEKRKSFVISRSEISPV